MRKYLYLAMTAASVAALAAPAAAAAATSASGHVLTIGRAGGKAVAAKAVLKAGLAKGTTAVFSLGKGKSAETLTCKSAGFSATVVSNPAKPGKATESQTAQTVGNCTVNKKGIVIKGVKALNLPYKVTVSDSKGDPVTVTGSKKGKPIELAATAAAGSFKVTCTYKIGTLKASASNKGNTITITNQEFFYVSGGIFCPAKANFSAKFGPVTDSSVKKGPAVFVN